MKSIGILRKVDELGRIVIPKELRKKFGITDNVDYFEISVEGDTILLKKYAPGCALCGGTVGLADVNGHDICADCRAKIKNMD
ncbi:MAG: AbrB/MazE/SpoVT family DNA-binding domain-containing protein [Clostridiales bacterium]|nr:AbrB/MazE/SpoVT family DNA-binding domain-containing protein [Clostridiales bacterium]